MTIDECHIAMEYKYSPVKIRR